MSHRCPTLPQVLAATSVDWSAALAVAVKGFDCVTGTIHKTDAQTGLLKLIAHQGIPPQALPMLLPKIESIPFGKGIAGCAAERKEAVQLCNLQEDLGGVAKPDARKTNVQGALAVPIFGAEGKVIGVLGVGKMQPYDFSQAEIDDLASVAQAMSKAI